MACTRRMVISRLAASAWCKVAALAGENRHAPAMDMLDLLRQTGGSLFRRDDQQNGPFLLGQGGSQEGLLPFGHTIDGTGEFLRPNSRHQALPCAAYE